MLNNNFLPERTAPIRKQRDTQLTYPPLTNLINLLTANRKTSSLIYQDILSLSLSDQSNPLEYFFYNQPPTSTVFPYPKTSCKTSPPNVSCSREIRSSNQRSSLSEKLCEKKRRRYLDEDERMEDSVRRSSGRFFSPRSGDPLPVRITRIAGGVGGWRRVPNEISRYVNAGRRVLSLSLYEETWNGPRNQIRERDLPRFRVVGCVQRLRGNRGPTSTACLSLSRPYDARLPFAIYVSSTRVSYAFCFM